MDGVASDVLIVDMTLGTLSTKISNPLKDTPSAKPSTEIVEDRVAVASTLGSPPLSV